MGEVWRAWDQDLERDVAIKILPAEFTVDAERVGRFKQEAFAVSALNRKLVTCIGTHTSPVLSIAFSPDGKQIVSGERDHSVRLYTRHRMLWGWRWD